MPDENEATGQKEVTFKSGKFDELAASLMFSHRADAVCVMIAGHTSGFGFSVACIDRELMNFIPSALRKVAESIERNKGECTETEYTIVPLPTGADPGATAN